MPDFARLENLFFGALGKTEPEERQRFLDAECGQDVALREQVERLLAGQIAAGSFLEKPAAPEQTQAFAVASENDSSKEPELLGSHIGPYKLLQKLGEGGMGTVWVAEQERPVKRRVALKLIKAGMDSAQVIRRFEAERQALALMDHTNIAKVLDAGTTADGRPYFVMELVKGVPITKYCDEVHASIKNRLELLVQVCSAVQHAHQKGIIHRDIKPSNILVAMQDGKPVPKVIDFGVAKALHSRLADQSMYTEIGQIIGTLEYMAPEQAELSAMDIDTRADIYALGVLLYELLTGSTPITRERMKSAAFAEVIRLIKEEDPPKPSTRLTQSKESLANLAALRKTDPKHLSSELKGELDWVVLKALEKDRTCRYETANGLARDIQRYLADEVVEARPPSAGYRLRKFVRRNKGRVIAASLVFLALVTGIIGTTLGLVEARRQTEIARDEAVAKEQARAAESTQRAAAEANQKLATERLMQVEAEKKRADEEKRIAQAVKDFLQTKLLAQADTTAQANQLLKAGGLAAEARYNPTIKELLDRAAAELAGDKIEINFPKQPLVQAQILRTVGEAYRGVGESSTGIPFQTRSLELFKTNLGPDHPETFQSMDNLALGYSAAGKPDLALPLFEETLKLRKAKLGPDHSETLQTMNNLALEYCVTGKFDLALSLLEETLKLMKAKLGLNHTDTLESMGNLATVYQAAGKLDLALPLLEETLKLMKVNLGPDHPSTLNYMGNLATVYRAGGKHDLAMPLLEETLKLMKGKLGPHHPVTLATMNNLAVSYQSAGLLDKAVLLYEEALKLMKAKHGSDHPNTLKSMVSLASGYQAVMKHNLALPLFEETLKLQKAKLGTDHPDTLSCMYSLADCYWSMKQHDKSIPLCEEALKLLKAKLGHDHPLTLRCMSCLAAGYMAASKQDMALPLFEETLKLQKTKLGTDHPDTLSSINNLAACYWSMKQFDKSIPLFEELLPRQEKKLGRGHPSTQMTVANLGVNYKDTGRYAEALPLLEEANHAAKKIPALRFIGSQLLDVYAKTGKLTEVRKLIEHRLANARKELPKDSPQLASQLARFGQTLIEVKTYTEAEPLLRECLTIRDKTQPDAWTTYNTMSMLGGALLGQKKYADAEPLMLKGYEGMKAREKTIPPQSIARLPEALDRLIQLYTETNKPDEVKKWQAEKENRTITEKKS